MKDTLKNESEEEIKVVFENEKIKIERIDSYGAVSGKDSWYDSDCDEWVAVTRGEATLEFESKKTTLKANESHYIKAHVRHRVDYTTHDCQWLCVYVK